MDRCVCVCFWKWVCYRIASNIVWLVSLPENRIRIVWWALDKHYNSARNKHGVHLRISCTNNKRLQSTLRIHSTCWQKIDCSALFFTPPLALRVSLSLCEKTLQPEWPKLNFGCLTSANSFAWWVHTVVKPVSKYVFVIVDVCRTSEIIITFLYVCVCACERERRTEYRINFFHLHSA